MDLHQPEITMGSFATAAEIDPPAHRSGSLDEQPFPGQPLNKFLESLPAQLRSNLSKIVEDLEACLGSSARFDAKKIPQSLRARVYDLLYTQDLVEVQKYVRHELPPLEPDWEFDLPCARGFLLRPPQPTSKTGTAAAAAAAGSSRQRVTKEHAGQQPRNFNSYNSNKPLALSSDDSRSLVFVTSPCKDQDSTTIVGQYRCWVCADTSEQKPDNGHEWTRVKLAKAEGGVQPEAWVDVSIGLGVWEPQVQPRKRSRSGSVLSPSSSLQGDLPGLPSPAQPLTAAGLLPAGAATIAGLALNPMQPPMMPGAAPLLPSMALESVPASFMHELAPVAPSFGGTHMGPSFSMAAGGMQAGTWRTPLHQQVQQPHAQTGWQHTLQTGFGFGLGPAAPPEQAAAGPEDNVPTVLQPQLTAGNAQQQQLPLQLQLQLQQHQHQLQQLQQQQQMPLASALPHLPSMHPGAHVPSTLAGGLASTLPQMGMSQHAMPAACMAVPLAPTASGTMPPMPPTAATAAPPPAAEAAVSAGLSDLLNQLQQLELDKEAKQLGSQLLQAGRTGGDLLAGFLQDNTGSALQQQQQQQQQQFRTREQAAQQMVQLLKGNDVVDDKQRNLLHLVATHSFGVPLQARQRQLDLLLGCDGQLATQLMTGRNSNGSTPLMVAASGIKEKDHAHVLQRLLQAADAVVLTSTSKSGWTLLHCLANEASKAGQGSQCSVLLQQLMHGVLRRVQLLAAELAGQGTSASDAEQLVRMLVLSREPTSRFYTGHGIMQQLQQEFQATAVARGG